MMCGIAPNELCRWSEALPGQFGFTKQLVFRVALPHITLLFLSISYVLLGALILTGLDYGIAQGGGNGIFDAEHRLFEAKKHFLDEMLNGLVGLILVRNNSLGNNNSSINANFSIAQNSFQHFASRVYELSVERKHLEDTGPGLRSKSFIWNVFFSTTWLTSIGYGENAPSGIWKRLFCIVYLIFGIPLYLVTLADLAKFCTEGINRFYTEFVKMRFHLICWYRQRRRRIYSSEYSMEYLAIHLKRWRRRRCTKTSTDSSLMWTTTRTEEEMAEFIWKHLEKTHFVEVPFTLIYLLLLTYILCSTLFVAYLEQWTFFNSLYFIMMSVLTIGFGDIVPGNSEFILPILFIIIVGLIVATTFIDMVGAYYIDRLHFFGRRMDFDDPLEWLKAVQQRRIEAMKREAMRKLFETATAMYRFNVVMPPLSKLPPSPNRRREPEVVIPMPRGIAPFNVTADSVTLKWEPPTQILLEGKKFWYTLSYKMRTPQRMNTIKTIDFLRQNRFTINGLKSFTLYEFNVRISTNEGISKPARCQEYTEPCTVPQLLQLDAISSETATISWRSPKMNNGPEEYLLLFVQEPAPQFQYWRRYEVGKRKRFTLTNLNADTRYIVCILAVHNFGLATISRSLRFKTRSWWYEEEKEEENEPEKVMEKLRRNFLAPPNLSRFMMTAARRPSLREPSIGANSEAATHKSSLQSGEYQDRS